MRMRSIVVLCLLVLMGIGASAQKAPNGSQGAKAPFTMTISTEHETITSGSKVIVTIHLTNVSDRLLTFPRSSFGGPDPSYRVEVRNSEEQVAPYTGDYGKRFANLHMITSLAGLSATRWEKERL